MHAEIIEIKAKDLHITLSINNFYQLLINVKLSCELMLQIKWMQTFALSYTYTKIKHTMINS